MGFHLPVFAWCYLCIGFKRADEMRLIGKAAFVSNLGK